MDESTILEQSTTIYGQMDERLGLVFLRSMAAVRAVLRSRPLYVLFEKQLGCDPALDHKTPRDVSPLFESELAKVESKFLKSLQASVFSEIQIQVFSALEQLNLSKLRLKNDVFDLNFRIDVLQQENEALKTRNNLLIKQVENAASDRAEEVAKVALQYQQQLKIGKMYVPDGEIAKKQEGFAQKRAQSLRRVEAQANELGQRNKRLMGQMQAKEEENARLRAMELEFELLKKKYDLLSKQNEQLITNNDNLLNLADMSNQDANDGHLQDEIQRLNGELDRMKELIADLENQAKNYQTQLIDQENDYKNLLEKISDELGEARRTNHLQALELEEAKERIQDEAAKSQQGQEKSQNGGKYLTDAELAKLIVDAIKEREMAEALSNKGNGIDKKTEEMLKQLKELQKLGIDKNTYEDMCKRNADLMEELERLKLAAKKLEEQADKDRESLKNINAQNLDQQKLIKSQAQRLELDDDIASLEVKDNDIKCVLEHKETQTLMTLIGDVSADFEQQKLQDVAGGNAERTGSLVPENQRILDTQARTATSLADYIKPPSDVPPINCSDQPQNVPQLSANVPIASENANKQTRISSKTGSDAPSVGKLESALQRAEEESRKMLGKYNQMRELYGQMKAEHQRVAALLKGLFNADGSPMTLDQLIELLNSDAFGAFLLKRGLTYEDKEVQTQLTQEKEKENKTQIQQKFNQTIGKQISIDQQFLPQLAAYEQAERALELAKQAALEQLDKYVEAGTEQNESFDNYAEVQLIKGQTQDQAQWQETNHTLDQVLTEQKNNRMEERQNSEQTQGRAKMQENTAKNSIDQVFDGTFQAKPGQLPQLQKVPMNQGTNNKQEQVAGSQYQVKLIASPNNLDEKKQQTEQFDYQQVTQSQNAKKKGKQFPSQESSQFPLQSRNQVSQEQFIIQTTQQDQNDLQQHQLESVNDSVNDSQSKQQELRGKQQSKPIFTMGSKTADKKPQQGFKSNTSFLTDEQKSVVMRASIPVEFLVKQGISNTSERDPSLSYQQYLTEKRAFSQTTINSVVLQYDPDQHYKGVMGARAANNQLAGSDVTAFYQINLSDPSLTPAALFDKIREAQQEVKKRKLQLQQMYEQQVNNNLQIGGTIVQTQEERELFGVAEGRTSQLGVSSISTELQDSEILKHSQQPSKAYHPNLASTFGLKSIVPTHDQLLPLESKGKDRRNHLLKVTTIDSQNNRRVAMTINSANVTFRNVSTFQRRSVIPSPKLDQINDAEMFAAIDQIEVNKKGNSMGLIGKK